ncbi:hypothetical protein Tco_0911518 [Tanacetum coccineum]|uniref:Uncharacterized protein n=1 Tax=Tanacetum coccineum TaxID=301880 RepID=A0ABQ5CZ63_9ASTR
MYNSTQQSGIIPPRATWYTSPKKSGIMEIEPDIENMTLNGYFEYEAEKERRLWDSVQSRRSPTNYDEADVDSFHQNKNVERIRQFLTPNIPDVIEDVIQPLIPTTLHTTPPNEDYVALATKPILEKLLEDKILNVAMVDEEADPTRDLEEPERLLVKYPHFMEIHVHSVITKLEPLIHTQPLSPVYRIFESYKSSTKLYKVDSFYMMMHMESGWLILATRTHFKSGLVRHHAIDDDGIFVIVDFARRSKLEAWLRACCLFIISSKIQGSVLFKFLTIPPYISIPCCTIGTLYKSSGKIRVELPLD